jgi:hypothetical protein
MINIPANVAIAIHNASVKTGVDEKILLAIAKNESNFAQWGNNKSHKSSTGVEGLFQITHKTWYGIRGKAVPYSTDFNEQAYTEALLIKRLMQKYNNNMYLVTIALDAGEGVSNFIQKWGNAVGNNIAIKKAVEYYKDIEAGFGDGKVKEIIDYPTKFAKSLEAVGGPKNLTASLNNNNNTSSDSTNWYDVGINKDNKLLTDKINDKNPFIINLFAANISGVDDLNKITPETIKNSTLISRIRKGLAS